MKLVIKSEGVEYTYKGNVTFEFELDLRDVAEIEKVKAEARRFMNKILAPMPVVTEAVPKTEN